MTDPRYSSEKEYETLRAELMDAKRYVFERPILIITVGLASIQLVEKDYVAYLAPIVVWLLAFNLWFTVNRIGSSARIVAYIQVALENKNFPWFGWETSLRVYRRFLKEKKMTVKTVSIKREIEYDCLGYYPAIFSVHIAVNWFIALLSVKNAFASPSCDSWIVAFVVVLSIVVFTVYAIKNKPNEIRPQIEQNRQIWIEVFTNWNSLTSHTKE